MSFANKHLQISSGGVCNLYQPVSLALYICITLTFKIDSFMVQFLNCLKRLTELAASQELGKP